MRSVISPRATLPERPSLSFEFSRRRDDVRRPKRAPDPSIVWNGPVIDPLVGKLQGTDRRSIGRSEEVVGDVLADPGEFHLVTGIVVRALAAHSRYRHSADTRRAAELLKSRFFHRDVYPDRAASSNWLIFSYPFWWTDLLSALDSLAQIGFRPDDPDIARGMAWFLDNQDPSGLWNTGRNRPKGPHSDLWVGLAICRMLNAISA